MKRIICLLLSATLLLTGCDDIKDKLLVRNKKTTSITAQVEENPAPTAETLSMPKISGIQIFGKEWTDRNLSMTQIGWMEGDMSETVYMPVNKISGLMGETGVAAGAQLICMPNRPDFSLEKDGGQYIETGFRNIAKTVVNLGKLYTIGTTNAGNLAAKVYSTADRSELSYYAYPKNFQGEGRDLVVNGDGGCTIIGNIAGEDGRSIGFIGRLDSKSQLLWSNEISFDGTDMWFDQMVRLDDERVLILCHIYEEIGYKVLLVEKGEVIKSLDLNYIAQSIQKAQDGSCFVLGTDKKISSTPFDAVVFETKAEITKIDENLNVLHGMETDLVNRYTDFIRLEEDVYMFIGSKDLDGVMTTFYDNGTSLELIKTETYSNQGIPTQILRSFSEGKAHFMMTGYNLADVGAYTCSYGWMSYLYELNRTLESMYARMLNNDGEVRYLVRGESMRRKIALAIAASEGNEELMYIRYMRSDSNYAFVITGKWDACQEVTQYLLMKGEDGSWQVIKAYSPDEKAIADIKAAYPQINTDILPPFEVSEYEIHILDDEEIARYIELADTAKTISNLDYISYIDEYLVIMFDDDTGYMMINPEDENRKIHRIQAVDYYNLYLMNEDHPPYFIFMQD